MTNPDYATDWLGPFLRWAVIILELAGTLAILIGAAFATAMFIRATMRPSGKDAFRSFRSSLGRSILVGLEFLVAGDIVKSLVMNPTLQDLLVLAGLIFIRTFLSVSLGVEINGHWPWQEARLSGSVDRLSGRDREPPA
jgi:uncharacterized membrane protein